VKLSQRFFQSYIWHIIGKIAGVVMMVLGSVLVVRLLGVDKYGAYAIVLSVIKLVQFGISFGHEVTINTYLPKFLAREEEQGKVSQLLRYILAKRLLYFGITALVLFFGAPLIALGFEVTDLVSYIRLGILVIGLEYFTAVFKSIFTAKVHTRGVVKLGIFTQALNLALIYLALRFGFGIAGLLWATIIPTAISLAVLAYISAEYFRLPRAVKAQAKVLDIKPVRSYSLNVWLQNVFSYALGKQTDISLMGLFKIPLASVGCYNIAFELNNKIEFFAQGTGLLTLSSISESYTVSGAKGLCENWTKLMKINLITIMPVMAFTIANAGEIIDILYTAVVKESIMMFYIFVSIHTITMLLGPSLNIHGLLVLGKQRTVLNIMILSGLLNMFLDLALIPLIGAVGAVIATSFSVLFAHLMLAVIFWRKVGFFYPFDFVIRLILGLSLAAIPTIWIAAERIRGLFFEGVVFLVLVLFFFRLLRIFSEQDKAKLTEINPLLGKFIKHL